MIRTGNINMHCTLPMNSTAQFEELLLDIFRVENPSAMKKAEEWSRIFPTVDDEQVYEAAMAISNTFRRISKSCYKSSSSIIRIM